MSSITSLMPVEEYLRLSEKPGREYRAGVLTPKAMPTKLHALIQFLLIERLRQQNVEALGEVTVRLSERTFLIPDVVAATAIEDPYPTKPVHLCCEILSPEDFCGAEIRPFQSKDRLGSMLAKCEEYHAWGVPFCWVIDPVRRVAWEYHLGGEPIRVGPSDILRAGELAVNLAELFASARQ